MAENLIINGVDHAKFDLEWVKKGGVAVFKRDNFSCFWTIFQGNIYTIAGSHPYYGTTPVPPEERFLASFKNADITKMQERMATPAECKAAGIEYIEYHGWRPIESAPTGEVILAYVPHTAGGYVAPVLLQAGTFNNVVSTTYDKEHPTHWMPLPTAPKDE